MGFHLSNPQESDFYESFRFKLSIRRIKVRITTSNTLTSDLGQNYKANDEILGEGYELE